MGDSLRHLQSLRAGSGMAILFLLLAWESVAPFLPHFGKELGGRASHAARNFLLGVTNVILTAAGMTALWTLAAAWASAHHFGFLNAVPLPAWTHALAAIVLFDCWTYLWHRANHRLPFLWRFHRTHHSDPKMDVTTANRFHFGEI